MNHTDFPSWYANTISTLDGDHPGYVFRVNESLRGEPQGSRISVVPPADVINGDFEFGVLEVPEIGTPAETSAVVIAGWDYHGGAGAAHVDYLELNDYDLEFDSDNTSKRHNWLYVPEDAYKFVFDAKGEIAIVQSDQFWLYLRSHGGSPNSDHFIFSTTATTAAKGWEHYEVPITDYADSVIRFTFGLTAPGTFNFIDSQVQLDNISFLRYSSADFNRDGIVDGNDLAVWQAGYGTGTLGAEGDADGDGDVDGCDFLAWQREYASAGSLVASVSVPEPGSFLLMACVGCLLCLTHRPRGVR